MIDVDKIFENINCIEKKSLFNRPSRIPAHKYDDQTLPKDILFERRLWRLFYNMGAQVLNNKNELRFEIKEVEGANQNQRQVDVFAILRDKYVFFIECKTTSIIGKKATTLITREVPQLKGLQSPLKSRFENFFGSGKYIPIHIIATQGFTWEPDNFNKVKNDFIVLRDEELKYFEECYKASENSWFTFNQFLGFFRNGNNDFAPTELNEETNRMNKKNLEVVAFKTRVGKKMAYTTSMKVKDLLNISTVSHKRASNIYEVDDYIQGYYQRILKKSRLTGVKGLPNFIKSKNEAFVNNLLINYRGKQSLNSKFRGSAKDGQGRGGILSFDVLSPGMFHLIDGQHRLFGYSPLLQEDGDSVFGNHELIITLFDNITPTEEAKIFLNINENQKPIDAGLKYQVNLIFGEDGAPDVVIQNIAASIVEGFSVPHDDKTKESNRLKSPFLSPKAIKDNENIQSIDLITGAEEPAGKLTTRSIITEIKKSIMLSLKGHVDYKLGLGYKKDYASTIEKISNVYIKYFNDIRTANEGLWVKAQANGNSISNNEKIARNYIIGGLVLLLDRFIAKRVLKANEKISELIDADVKKLCKVIEGLSLSKEVEFFGTQKYGDGGSVAYDLFLTETYFSELLTEKDLLEISKKKADHKNKKIIYVQDPILLKENEDQWRELEGKFSQGQIALKYRKYFRSSLHILLSSIFGKEYWNTIIREELKTIYDQSYKLRKAKEDEVAKSEGPDFQLKKTDLAYVEWVEWKQILVFIFSKNNKLDKYIDPNFALSKKFKDDYKGNLKIIIKEIFFINKNIENTDAALCLNWMDAVNKMRRSGAHEDEDDDVTPSEKNNFEALMPKIKETLSKIRTYNNDLH